jgi:hypothetical protein
MRPEAPFSVGRVSSQHRIYSGADGVRLLLKAAGYARLREEGDVWMLTSQPLIMNQLIGDPGGYVRALART